MDIVDKLFGSPQRVRLLRLFLFNSGIAFSRKSIIDRSKVSGSKLVKELNLLKKIKLIKERKIKTKGDIGKPGSSGFELNPGFPLINSLRTLLNQDFLQKRTDISRRFKNCGRLKLLVVSGIFLDNDDGRIDLFIVGDRLKKNVIDRTVKTIEADIGRELTYATLETEDFVYRLSSSDKFIRDIFDYPHERIVDRISIQ